MTEQSYQVVNYHAIHYKPDIFKHWKTLVVNLSICWHYSDTLIVTLSLEMALKLHFIIDNVYKCQIHTLYRSRYLIHYTCSSYFGQRNCKLIQGKNGSYYSGYVYRPIGELAYIINPIKVTYQGRS